MSNLIKLEFVALDISSKNYLSWILVAQIHLDAMGLGDTIKENNEASLQDKAKAMIFLRRHISEELKTEYLTERNPLCLWNNLKKRYDHQKTVILPKAKANWLQLRLQDFKTMAEYNSALFKISSTLKLCEQNNELLLRNHQSRPTGSTPIPETYVASSRGRGRGHGRASSRGRGRGRGRGCGRGGRNEYGRGKNNFHNNEYGRGRNHSYYREGYQSSQERSYPQRKDHNEMRQVKRKDVPQPSKTYDNTCYRCGMTGHWQNICRTPKYLADLYQASMKEKGKQKEMNFLDHDEPVDTTNLEMNFINHDEPVNITNLDVSDFFDDHDGRIDFLIGDGNVHTS
ncbi:uncharacterized protein LOC132313798 [Cornus florida]|uniref:uncharacterized protein LOC132313798 n=1 Tax=Cornus florida TaxID=4283 RepID=UPI00289BC50A|nr:uncharacterized protein LOC132313798 [Cornus florida]